MLAFLTSPLTARRIYLLPDLQNTQDKKSRVLIDPKDITVVGPVEEQAGTLMLKCILGFVDPKDMTVVGPVEDQAVSPNVQKVTSKQPVQTGS